MAQVKRRKMRFYHVGDEVADEDTEELLKKSTCDDQAGSQLAGSKRHRKLAEAAAEREKENASAQVDTTPITDKRSRKSKKSDQAL
eukprot:2910865-Pleurochrysis_carterae.AAC.1